MELDDALTITMLGMGVVFSGLALTSLLILTFGAVPRLAERWSAKHDAVHQEASRPEASHTGEPVDPEIVSVITAVLEVERRLYHAEDGGQLTITRVRST